MGKGRVGNDKKIEDISLEISNYWTSNDFLTESNKNCGTLVAFDWVDDYLSEINTNIDLNKTECENFKYYRFIHFLKENNFNHVLGLRNVAFEDNPSPVWTDKLKETLKSNSMDYDEYVVDKWPLRIPEFDIPDNIFILRYAYDEYCKVDKLAASSYSFKNWLEASEWKEYYKKIASEVEYRWDPHCLSIRYREVVRVTVFCSMIENFILKGRTYKMLFKK